MTAPAFAKNELVQNAVVRQLEIIGEAANQVSKTGRNNLPDIEWAKINGMRNKLIHEYFGVDLNVVWTTIQNELPGLKKKLRKHLKNE